MATSVMTAYGLFFAVCVVWRAWYQRRRTGESGLRGIGRADNARAWSAGMLLLAGHGLIVGHPLLVALGRAPAVGVALPLALCGGALILVALSLVVVAQLQMGASWRIAVEADERTALVEHGLFAHVRNPIFTGVMAVAAGSLLLVPRWPMALGLGLVIAGIELQVRGVEEPYLARVHGAAYDRYRRRAGRFLPGLGRR